MRCSIKTLFESVVRPPSNERAAWAGAASLSASRPRRRKPHKATEASCLGKRLKLVLLIAGLVTLTVGLLGALYGIVAASGAQAEYDVFCPTGQMPPPFGSLLLSSISTYHTITLAMGMVSIVGLAATIAALAIKGPLFSTVPTFVPVYPPPLPPSGMSTSRTCSKCGRTNLATDRFCANCGAPLS